MCVAAVATVRNCFLVPSIETLSLMSAFASSSLSLSLLFLATVADFQSCKDAAAAPPLSHEPPHSRGVRLLQRYV